MFWHFEWGSQNDFLSKMIMPVKTAWINVSECFTYTISCMVTHTPCGEEQYFLKSAGKYYYIDMV